MKVGFVQCRPRLGDLDATLASLDPLVRSAAGADLLVLPELCNSGYDFPSAGKARLWSEEIGDGPFVSYLVSRCREQDLHIVSGINERAGERLYNSAVLVGPEGWVGTYRKLHLFRSEKEIFAPGDLGLPVFRVGPWRIGMLVCFDWIFPEAWRVLALAGADIICHPSNLVLPGLAQRAVPIHGLVNRVYVITANRTGREGSLTFTGNSLVSGPAGDLLAEAPASGEHVGLVEIDPALARDKKVTDRNDVFRDRRPEEYARLCRPR